MKGPTPGGSVGFLNVSQRQTVLPKVCFVATVGGHLAQLQALGVAAAASDAYLVTVRSPHARSIIIGDRKYYVPQILRNPITFVLNFLQSMRILLREQPDVVVTTGAGDALPTTLLAAALGIPIVFVESMARVTRPSLFGRLVHHWVDLVLVQWKDLKRAYPEAVVVAPLFRPRFPPTIPPSNPSIVVLTGTQERGFERLLRSLDRLLRSQELDARVFAQIGYSNYTPQRYKCERFLPHDELRRKIEMADLIITHDGSGSIGDALLAGKPAIVVPRKVSEGEVYYRSGSDLARRLEDLGWVCIADDTDAIPGAISGFRSERWIPFADSFPEAPDVVRSFIQSLRDSPQARNKEIERSHRVTGSADEGFGGGGNASR